MTQAGRTLLHATLLGLLAVGAVYGVVMLVSYLMMIVGTALGWMVRRSSPQARSRSA